MAIAARIAGRGFVVPETPPLPQAVGENYEIFTPDSPELVQPVGGQLPLTGSPNRPGQGIFEGPQVNTRGGMGGLHTVAGGQPLSAARTSDRIHRPPGAYTLVRAPTIRLRKGVGQKGPSELGVAQTITQATRTAHLPIGGTTLLQMIAGGG